MRRVTTSFLLSSFVHRHSPSAQVVVALMPSLNEVTQLVLSGEMEVAAAKKVHSRSVNWRPFSSQRFLGD